MASGCILGKCPVCDEFIWEDSDFDFVELPATMNGNHESMVHIRCRELINRDREAVAMILDKEEQFRELIAAKDELIKYLKEDNQKLRERIAFLTKPRIVSIKEEDPVYELNHN
jgi:hypothetical protein